MNRCLPLIDSHLSIPTWGSALGGTQLKGRKSLSGKRVTAPAAAAYSFHQESEAEAGGPRVLRDLCPFTHHGRLTLADSPPYLPSPLGIVQKAEGESSNFPDLVGHGKPI